MTARYVYFIEAGKNGHIKIGVATDVAVRLRDLQCANPKKLRLIVAVPGDHRDETRLHRRFADQRMSGEWFNGKGPVRDFAMSLINASPDAIVQAIKREPPENDKRKKARHKGSALRDYTPRQLYRLFHIADGDSIYRSAEAEELIAEERRRRREFGLNPNVAFARYP